MQISVERRLISNLDWLFSNAKTMLEKVKSTLAIAKMLIEARFGWLDSCQFYALIDTHFPEKKMKSCRFGVVF